MSESIVGPNCQIVAFEDRAQDDFKPPSYKEPGQLLFGYFPIPNEKPEVEVLGHTGAAFWLVEGGFPDYWVADNVHLELEGHYVLEGLTGHVIRSWEGEYDEEWDFVLCRRATPEEIENEALLEDGPDSVCGI